MTWKEFKDQVEEQGVKDDFEIIFIDISEHVDVTFDA